MSDLRELFNYIDPGQTGGSQPSFMERYPPQYDELSGAEWPVDLSDYGKSLASLVAPELMKGQRPALESAMLDLGQWINPPAKGAMAGLPLAAGMIRMGKEFPNAYLHRAIGDASELDWWSKLFQRGKSSQKPTSAVTPSVLQTFKSEPYGLMFNVNDPGQLKHVGSGDLWSDEIRRSQPELDRFYSAKDKSLNQLGNEITRIREPIVGRIEKAKQEAWDELSAPYRESDPNWEAIPALAHEFFQQWNPVRKQYENEQREALARLLAEQPVKDYSGLENRYRQAGHKMNDLFPRRFDWEPDDKLSHLLLDPNKDDLTTLFQKQLGAALNGETSGGLKLYHSELIPEIDRSMLAGVRLPLEEGVDWQYNLSRSLKNFAEQQGVPIFRFPAVETTAQQIKGLQKPFEGKWGYKPGSRDYITSSRLPQIFGITELP